MPIQMQTLTCSQRIRWVLDILRCVIHVRCLLKRTVNNLQLTDSCGRVNRTGINCKLYAPESAGFDHCVGTGGAGLGLLRCARLLKLGGECPLIKSTQQRSN